MGFPEPQGLYDPRNEHDACGVGFVAHIRGEKNHAIITQALEILKNIDHRGAVGADPFGTVGQLVEAVFRVCRSRHQGMLSVVDRGHMAGRCVRERLRASRSRRSRCTSIGSAARASASSMRRESSW